MEKKILKYGQYGRRESVIKRLDKYSTKKINRHEIISACIVSLDQSTRKEFFKELNSILIKELNIDYSSFFLNAHQSLNLYDSNIRSQTLRKELEQIISFRDPDGEDFSKSFIDEEIVLLERSKSLIYPTASHRVIRSAICMPLKGIGYWLIEDCRKIGEDDFVQELAKLSKLIEKLLTCHQKKYINDDLNIYTARAVHEEFSQVASSLSEVKITNLYDLMCKYGDLVRIELLELLVSELEKEDHLRGGIGIKNDDTLLVYTLATVDVLKRVIEKVVDLVQALKLSIEKDTVQLEIEFTIKQVKGGSAIET